MNFEEGSELTNLTFHYQQHQYHLQDWLEDSVTFLPSFLEEQQYSVPDDITGYDWWNQDLDQPHLIHTPAVNATLSNPPTIKPDSPLPLQAELSKKRKLPSHHPRRRATTDTTDGSGGGGREHEGELEVPRKKATGKGNGGSKEVRWAEQLLNPCATAIEAGNLSRVQHLLYVLQELASFSGDANHRLAAHGLSSLTQHISTAAAGAGTEMPGSAAAAAGFASTEPRLFRSTLIRFNEISPWFAFPNALANSSILQAVTTDSLQRPRLLHVVDIGVSHGVQWPTLLEALTRRQGGAPASIRLTLAESAAPPAPFSAAPPGYDFPSHLLRYAKLIDLNLQIDRAETLGSVSVTADETLVICVQFRAQSLVRGGEGEAFFVAVREMGPDLVVLSEIDGEGEGGLGFAEGFGRRSGLLWSFLESTSSAFKGRDCGERRVVEGEAARILDGAAAAAEGRGRWRERMVALGFREEGFGEEAVEAGRALLRKYDGNWEMRPPAAATAAAAPPEAVGLRWKGQPVSFCSLWKPVENRRIAGKTRC